jgi:hypothetical protein
MFDENSPLRAGIFDPAKRLPTETREGPPMPWTARETAAQELEIALLRVIAESRAGVELALDALARVAVVTIAESGYSSAARSRFDELLEVALMREG